MMYLIYATNVLDQGVFAFRFSFSITYLHAKIITPVTKMTSRGWVAQKNPWL